MITPSQLTAAAGRAGYMTDLVSRRSSTDAPMLSIWLNMGSLYPEVTVVFEPEGLTWGPSFEFAHRTFGDGTTALAEIVATVKDGPCSGDLR